jgi:hypothetical protein
MMLAADQFLSPPAPLSHLTFNFYDWDARAREPLDCDTAT